MKPIVPSLALVLLVSAAPALAQEGGSSTYTLIGVAEGGQYYWESPDGQRNPDLVVPAGQQVSITIRQGASSDGIPHNIQVGSEPESEFITNTDEELTYTFTAPTSGTLGYVCTVHPQTMLGTVRVAGEPAGDGGSGGDGGDGGDNGTPGPSLALLAAGLVGTALALGRRRTL